MKWTKRTFVLLLIGLYLLGQSFLWYLAGIGLFSLGVVYWINSIALPSWFIASFLGGTTSVQVIMWAFAIETLIPLLIGLGTIVVAWEYH